MSEGPVGRAETALAWLDKVIAQYRTSARALQGNAVALELLKREAVKEIKKLGYTEGDALRYLRPKGWRP
jgi:hypothetical protein